MRFKAHKILIYLSVLVCLVFSFALLTDTIAKYNQKMTNIGIIVTESHEEEKQLPCVTFCPWSVYKKPGFHYKSDAFRINTFEKEDIFQNISGFMPFDGSPCVIEELWSVFLGRCHMVCLLKPQRKLIMDYLTLSNEKDVKVFIHRREDRMLIPIGNPPVEINFFQMGINTSSEIISAEARITERHQIMLDKNGSCSNAYNKTYNFVVCSRNYFTKTLKENTTCSLPGFAQLTNEIAHAECQDEESAQENANVFTNMLYFEKHLWLKECPVPCEQTVYDAKVVKHHSNTMIGRNRQVTNEIRRKAVLLGLGYETFAVHEHVETLVYDAGNFLSQVGGNLGLFLGVSCLSILTGVIKFSRRFFRSGKSKPSLNRSSAKK